MGSVYADNAALTAGGQPRMMSSHPQVRMASEVVSMVVTKKRVLTDCTFVFRNSGKACTVRMGFPDFGMWAYAHPSKKARTRFKSYRSYVNGHPVKTNLILGKEPGEQWQVKQVLFPANGTVVVREQYTNEIGGIATKMVIASAAYVVHTGASWKGPIGHARFTLKFSEDTELPTPFQVKLGKWPKDFNEQVMDFIAKPGGIFATGPCQPTVKDRTMVFEKTNWMPQKSDDIYVFYRYPPKALEAEMKKVEIKN